MAKKRIDNHLKEISSEELVASLLPKEWVIRKLHPDYGVDVSIEVFERRNGVIPTMGEFLYVQLKATDRVKRSSVKILSRGNVEKTLDDQKGKPEFELEVVKFTVDSDTIDNARLMGPSTPLLLFVCDLKSAEVYFVCLTDYYDKIIEPRSKNLEKQDSFTLNIPASNRLTAKTASQVMRFYAARAKLYAMFNLAQFQYREIRYIFPELADYAFYNKFDENISLVRRFASRLRSMPIWDRELPWALIPQYTDRLDLILQRTSKDGVEEIKKSVSGFLGGADDAIGGLFSFAELVQISWEQFSAIGRTFEDIVREWFLPTFMGQLGSGEPDVLRDLKVAKEND